MVDTVGLPAVRVVLLYVGPGPGTFGAGIMVAQ